MASRIRLGKGWFSVAWWASEGWETELAACDDPRDDCFAASVLAFPAASVHGAQPHVMFWAPRCKRLLLLFSLCGSHEAQNSKFLHTVTEEAEVLAWFFVKGQSNFIWTCRDVSTDWLLTLLIYTLFSSFLSHHKPYSMVSSLIFPYAFLKSNIY